MVTESFLTDVAGKLENEQNTAIFGPVWWTAASEVPAKEQL